MSDVSPSALPEPVSNVQMRRSSFNNLHHLEHSWTHLPHGLKRAALIITIGAVVGCAEFGVTSLLAELVTNKFSTIQELVDDDQSQWKAYLIMLPVITVLSTIVVYLSPVSAGSSLPEIKGYLNGAYVPSLFGIVTTAVKALGVVVVIGCGYPVGREGPMVQMGCALAYQVARLPIFKSVITVEHDPSKTKEAEAQENAQERTLVVTIGGAAGIAGAFRSPIGGVLYMMEDMASYWNHETTVRAFGCTMVTTLVFSMLLNSSHGINYEALVVFDEDPHQADWKAVDVPYFIILALMCGVLSCCYSELLFFFQRVRKQRKSWRSPHAKVFEVFLVSAAICIIPLYIANLFGCVHDPTDTNECDPDHCNACTSCCKSFLLSDQATCDACVTEECDHHESGGGHGTMSLVRFTCDEHYYNEMATLWLMGEEGAIKQLYSRDSVKTMLFHKETLLAFLPVYLLMAGFCGGLAIPFGTFVPNLFMGAAFGRLFAVVTQDSIGITGLSSPGTYALIGAGSVLGGYTRMTITVVIMIAEASGDVSIIVPLMLSVQLSRWVANFLSECYDEKMMELRRIPFLHDEVEDELAKDTAKDVMFKAVPIKVKETVGNLRDLLEDRNAHYSAFPVVSEKGSLLGLVHGLVLVRVLAPYLDQAGNDAIVIPMDSIMDTAPHTVMLNFPLSRLFPLVRKLQVEHVVVLNDVGQPVGMVPRTALVVAEGQVHSTHHRAMKKLDMAKTASTMRRASMKVNTQMGLTGYEGGELYEEEMEAKNNMRKLSRWFSVTNKEEAGFVERNTTTEGVELATISTEKKAQL
ncbi:hypothetical protein TrST_g2935 [Triparma strigata]|uniref:Chloride channel protein n=1 Tax=Triparma strigata TaxID=1606541 RepID=A0A9W7AYU6_9STRA|nr:hypothetical protein TrST_g2935 [Triparma strigata]